jgi:cell wall-associated NlpC family hydrolase
MFALAVGCAAPPAPPTEPARTTAENVRAALDYGRSLIGTPYGWWTGGPLAKRAPQWTLVGPPPDAATVRAASANCAGLTNLMLRAVGKPLPAAAGAGTGGTKAYQIYYAAVAEPFDVTQTYPAGTLIGRRYRSMRDQGHVAVVLGNGRVLQSFATKRGDTAPGVNDTYTVQESHGAGYYEYAVLPQYWLGASGNPGAPRR